MRVIAAIISYYHHFFAFCGQESMKFFISLDILKFSNSQTNKQMHCKWIFNLMQWGQKFILQQHACQPSNKEFPLFYLKWNVLLGNTPRKNWGIHIAAFLSRQPLVKGERLVRYEVNAVMQFEVSRQKYNNTKYVCPVLGPSQMSIQLRIMICTIRVQKACCVTSEGDRHIPGACLPGVGACLACA